jgi:hypothetical protein
MTMLMLQLGVGISAAASRTRRFTLPSRSAIRTATSQSISCVLADLPPGVVLQKVCVLSLPPLTRSPLLGSFPLASASSYRMSS